MKAFRSQIFALLVLALAPGCTLLPVGRTSVAGIYQYPLGFNYGGTIDLQSDGHYVWSASLTYCSPIVVQDADGTTSEVLDGWTNQEKGTWRIHDGEICLTKESRHIENPNCEKENFDLYRAISVTRQPSGRVVLVLDDMVPNRRRMDRPPQRGVVAEPIETSR